MIQDIQVVQRELEGRFLASQPKVDQAALNLFQKAPQLAQDYLTEYSVDQAETTVKRWKKLGESLIVKYMDGNVKTEMEKVTHPGYPKTWYKHIVKETGDHYKVKEKKEDH
jgi:dipeptidase